MLILVICDFGKTIFLHIYISEDALTAHAWNCRPT